MNARIHRALTSASTTLAAVSALLSQYQPETLGFSELTWTWITVGFAIGTLVIQGLRQYFDPNPTS